MFWYNRYGTYQNTAKIKLCCLKIKEMYTQFYLCLYEPRDMYIKKIKKMTRLRIRKNVRYSDHCMYTQFYLCLHEPRDMYIQKMKT